MAGRATFTGLERYTLTGVTVTGIELGRGSNTIAMELDYMGMKCVGKEIHELLLRQGDYSYFVRRFEEGCHLLSQICHPNIVQFLGVHFQQGVQVPILVMEFLPTSLASCIEQHGILPKEISYSILHDVALGLCYLHNQIPPIIHRDLSSNNVLLTPNMTAKISDPGMARILTPAVSHMTEVPISQIFMPLEALMDDSIYSTSIDEFAYGILMIHILSGVWPLPTRVVESMLIAVSEAERREVYLQAIGNDHPLMGLILRCIDNNPGHRARASDIVEQLAVMTLQFPKRPEILRCFNGK